MYNIKNYILEKLILNKNTKIKKNNNSNINSETLYLANKKIDFPLVLEIDHRYKENIIGYKTIKSNKGNIWYNFYNDKNSFICSMSEKELILIFDYEKGIMLNTCYGWLATIWRK